MIKNLGAKVAPCPQDHRGITLIALIVTIIVLLILAGVSLNLISGSDGILGRATKAVSEHEKASIKEELELKVAEKMMAYYMGEGDEDIQTYLKEELDGESIVNGQYTVFPTIDDEGNLILSISDEDDNTVLGVVLDDKGKVVDELEADSSGNLQDSNPPKITRLSSTTSSITIKMTSISKVTAYACTETNTVTDGDWVTIDTPKQTVEVTIGNRTSGQTYYFWARNGSNIETTTPASYKAENFETIAARNVEWNGATAIVTVASLPQNGTLQYQLDGTAGSWIDFPTTGGISVETGHIVYFAISDGTQISSTASTPVFKDFTVSYNANLGSGSVPANQTVTHKATATVNFETIPTRTGYTFNGWDTNSSASSATYTSSGTTSYTMPGNDVTLYAIWIPNDGIAYTVVHKKMNLDGSTYETEETENLTGTAGASITPAVRTYTGFTAPSTQTTTINGDGSTEVTYLYTRNQYNYTLGSHVGVNTAGSTASGTIYYGETITLRAAANTGYNWSTWTGSVSSYTTTTANTEVTMPASDLNMTPNATQKTLVEQITSADYGKSTNYTCAVNNTTVSDWKVFLNDGSNVYLIYGDWLPANLVPSEAGLATDTSKYKYSVWSNTSVDDLISRLTNTSYWSAFAGGRSGSTATGAPTLAQFNSSRGQSETSTSLVGTSNLYNPRSSSESSCWGYWPASRFQGNSSITYYVSYDGAVTYDYPNSPHYAVRPLVCLRTDITGTVGNTVTINN